MVDETVRPHVLVMTRTACHLCDDAVGVVVEVAGAAGVSWSGHDVDADPELRAEFGDLVPVVLVLPAPPLGEGADALLAGAVEVGHYRIPAEALAGAIVRVRDHSRSSSQNAG